MSQTIGIIGTGYVGLVTGTCFAESGNNVLCIDVDQHKVETLQQGKMPIYEPGLEHLLERNISNGRLKFSTNLEHAVKQCAILFLCLPTPPGEDGSADLNYVMDAAKNIAEIIKKENITDFRILVNKSTVPVGTADKVRMICRNNAPGFDIEVVSNPEFLREGFAVDDFMKPDRVVVGTRSDRAKQLMGELYKPFIRQGNPLLFMDERSAELTKYAANAFLATKISFMNEIANFCEKVGADVDMVRLGIGTDDRIGKRFLFPGIGYGGSCFPKDVQALAKSGIEGGYEFKILKSVMKVNERQKTVMLKPILDHFKQSLTHTKIAIWGLAFKPDTDDIREAPALYMIEHLLEAGATITAYDPEAMENVKKQKNYPITYTTDAYEALRDADAVLICTEWGLFRNPDFEKISSLLKSKVIFDGRNLYELEKMEQLGYTYYSIGRNTVHAK